MKKSELIQILGLHQPEDSKIFGLLLFKAQDSEAIRQLKSILRHPQVIDLPADAPLPSEALEAVKKAMLQATDSDSRTKAVLDNLRRLIPLAENTAGTSSSSLETSTNSNAVEKTISSAACKMNIIIINKYKDKIRQFIKPMKFAPSPEMILYVLLKDYITGINLPGFQFVKSITSSHTNFANQLITAFNKSDFDLLEKLDNYLSKHKLDINGDFFALLLAYFDYYGSQYEFSEFKNVKKQIFIPLHVYHQRIATEQLNTYLAALTSLSTFDDLQFEEMNSNKTFKFLELEDLKLHDLIFKFSSIRNLDFLSGNKSSDLVLPVLNLLNLIKRIRVLACRSGGVAYNTFLQHAFNVLCAIPIPKELQPIVVDNLLSKSNSEQIDSEMRESACRALGIIPLPADKRQIVISNLLQLARSRSWPMRQTAWEALEKIGVSEQDKLAFINERLNIIKQCSKHSAIDSDSKYYVSRDDHHNLYKLHDACIQLTTMSPVSIADEKKSEIILAVLNLNYTQCPEEFYLVLKYLTPKAMKDRVIDRLLVDFKTQRTRRTSDLIQTINKLNPSGEKLVEVLREFINHLRLHPQDSYYIVEMLTYTHIPKEIQADTSDALIQLIPHIHPAHLDHFAAGLVNVGIPDGRFAELLSQLSSAALRSRYKERNADIYAVFSKAEIPPELRNSFMNDLIKGIGSYSVDRALAKMALTYGECIQVINALLMKLQNNDGNIQIIETLISLQKYLQPHESVAIKIKLEEMIQTMPEKTAHLIMPYMKEFDKLCDIKMQLAQRLPLELIPEILLSNK